MFLLLPESQAESASSRVVLLVVVASRSWNQKSFAGASNSLLLLVPGNYSIPYYLLGMSECWEGQNYITAIASSSFSLQF